MSTFSCVVTCVGVRQHRARGWNVRRATAASTSLATPVPVLMETNKALPLVASVVLSVSRRPLPRPLPLPLPLPPPLQLPPQLPFLHNANQLIQVKEIAAAKRSRNCGQSGPRRSGPRPKSRHYAQRVVTNRQRSIPWSDKWKTVGPTWLNSRACGARPQTSITESRDCGQVLLTSGAAIASNLRPSQTRRS